VVVSMSVTAQVAKRKANGWLIGYVGNMLMVDHGALVHVGILEKSEWIWRFEVFITSLAHEPMGPIGTLDVNATDGTIVDDEHTKAMLCEHGRTYQSSE
jgi:hypothetical protein